MTTQTDGQLGVTSTQAPASEDQSLLSGDAGTQDAAASTTPPAETPPAEYVYEMPEGVDLDEAGATQLTEFAKEHKLPPAAAQKLATLYAERVKAQAEVFNETVKSWETDVLKTYGDKWVEARTTAKAALETYGTPELKALLDSSRMGSHPEVVKFFHAVGKTLNEDKKLVVGQPKAAPTSFYDKSNMSD